MTEAVPPDTIPVPADAELIALAADYAAANTEIRRLEANGEKRDESFKPLDERRSTALQRATALPATSLAGMRAKAEIYLGEVAFQRVDDRDEVEILADSLARDLLKIGI